MGETPPLFATTFNASVSVEARPEHLTSDAGAVLLREVLERSGIVGWLTERLVEPRQPHLVTYPLADLLRTMLVLSPRDGMTRTTPTRCASTPPCGWPSPARGAPRRWRRVSTSPRGRRSPGCSTS